jgi:hypothetical protein
MNMTSKDTTRPKLPEGIIQANPPGVNIGPYMEPGCLRAYLVIRKNEGVVYCVHAIILKHASNAAQEEAIALARLAHREMIVRAAQEAGRMGLREFVFRGEYASPDFHLHADKLARDVGVPGSGRTISVTKDAFPRYEVTLDVAKVLGSQ